LKLSTFGVGFFLVKSSARLTGNHCKFQLHQFIYGIDFTIADETAISDM